MKLRVPDRFTFLGREWTVVREELDDCDGFLDERHRVVKLQAGMSEEDEIETFLHEVSGHASFPKELVSDKTEDVIVSAGDLGRVDAVRALVSEED